MLRLVSLARTFLVGLFVASCVAFGQITQGPDLWNITNGVVVTDHSHFSFWQNNPSGFDARDVFGGNFTTVYGERGDIVFDDYSPSVFTNYLEWSTPVPVTIGAIQVYARGDGPLDNSRQFNSITLKTKSFNSTNFDRTFYQNYPAVPYTYIDTNTSLLISTNFPVLTAQYFRAEFISAPGQRFPAPRILELVATGPSNQSAPRVGTVRPILSNGFLTGITVIDPGTGYTNIPNVYVYGSGAGAQLKANITNGHLESIDVENPGRGYDSNTVVIVDPPAVEAPRIASANAFVTNGTVSGIQITDLGSGYTVPPVVIFIGGGGIGAVGTANVFHGRVVGITINSPGSGYKSPPRVAFTPPGSSGILSLEVSAVKVSIGVMIGNRYQLISTSDFANWNPVGDPFIATTGLYEQNVVVTESARYFALVLVP